MKKLLFAAVLSTLGLASAVQASGCNSPYCQGGGFFGSRGSHGQPAFQAAPWYLYWPYNNHFMTPAPMQGGAYGGYGGTPGGGLSNPYFPGGGYNYPSTTPSAMPSAMPPAPTMPPAPMPQPYSPPAGAIPPLTQPPAGATPPVTPGVSIPVIPVAPGVVRTSARR